MTMRAGTPAVASSIEWRADSPPAVDAAEHGSPFATLNPDLAARLVPTADGALVEQYRKVAATLHHAQKERGTRVLMIASAMASEGKTLTASNLALTLSESYRRRVLLIDADLRRPSLQTVFQVPNIYGLGDLLKGAGSGKLSVFDVNPWLAVAPAGRPDPNPISGLTSERMRQLLEDATASYDWVIIDTPPVGLLPDANLLAAMVDVAILVIAAGRTPYRLVERAVSALGRDRILGAVLNRVEAATSGGYDYYHYYGTRPQSRPWFWRGR